jgi:hypothetical protein
MKIYIFSLVFVFSLMTINAQKFNFGARIGSNYSNLDINSLFYTLNPNSFEHKSMVGVNLSFYSDINIYKKISIQPELSFSWEGGSTNFEPQGASALHFERKYNLAYLNIPILIKYNITEKFNFFAGPQIGLLIYGEDSTKNQGGIIETDNYGQFFIAPNHTTSKDTFKTFNFGIAYGLSYNFHKNFNLDLRYVKGLTNIRNEPSTTFKSNVFQFGLGYKF